MTLTPSSHSLPQLAQPAQQALFVPFAERLCSLRFLGLRRIHQRSEVFGALLHGLARCRWKVRPDLPRCVTLCQSNPPFRSTVLRANRHTLARDNLALA